MDVSVSYNNPVWVLVIPSSSSAFVNVTATTNYSYSSYSYSSYDYIYIIIPTVVGGTMWIIWGVLIIVCCIISRKLRMLSQNNMAGAVIEYRENQAPQLYYPPQQNNSVVYTNQGAVVMGTQYSTYPSPQTPRQNVYIIEPTPRTSEPIAYGPTDPVPQNSIYVAQGESVNQ